MVCGALLGSLALPLYVKELKEVHRKMVNYAYSTDLSKFLSQDEVVDNTIKPLMPRPYIAQEALDTKKEYDPNSHLTEFADMMAATFGGKDKYLAKVQPVRAELLSDEPDYVNEVLKPYSLLPQEVERIDQEVQMQAMDKAASDVEPSLREGSVTRQTLERFEASSYDTLYSNAESGDTPFKGMKVTEMTLGELSEFSKPSGEYGQWVKPRLAEDSEARAKGLTSTPMGRYQMVGTTLRSVMKQMNLPADTKFNDQTQDAMFIFLAKDAVKRGKTEEEKMANMRNVWEGLKKASDDTLLEIIEEIGD